MQASSTFQILLCDLMSRIDLLHPLISKLPEFRSQSGRLVGVVHQSHVSVCQGGLFESDSWLYTKLHHCRLDIFRHTCNGLALLICFSRFKRQFLMGAAGRAYALKHSERSCKRPRDIRITGMEDQIESSR